MHSFTLHNSHQLFQVAHVVSCHNRHSSSNKNHSLSRRESSSSKLRVLHRHPLQWPSTTAPHVRLALRVNERWPVLSATLASCLTHGGCNALCTTGHSTLCPPYSHYSGDFTIANSLVASPKNATASQAPAAAVATRPLTLPLVCHITHEGH